MIEVDRLDSSRENELCITLLRCSNLASPLFSVHQHKSETRAPLMT